MNSSMFLKLLAVRHHVGGVHLRTLATYGIRWPSIVTGLAVADGAVVVAPAADDVEPFQGEAGRIDLAMASGTGLDLAVLGQLFADRRGAADVRLDGRHVRRRRGGGVPRMRSSTHAPRTTGEVVVPLAVTLSTLAIVSTPPR